jgi:hypothetical protein
MLAQTGPSVPGMQLRAAQAPAPMHEYPSGDAPVHAAVE